jgi:hypothetical protein
MNLSDNKKNASKRLVIGGVAILLIVLALVAAGAIAKQRIEQKGPPIGLMTSLPLRWPENDGTTLLDPDAEPSKAFQRLQQRQPVKLLDDFAKLSRLRVLLLAQLRALSPAELVALDKWVRAGGRALILADPALAWESNFAVGDRRRPLFTSLLSPLFGHWGLNLVLNIDAKSRDEIISIQKMTIKTQTTGAWDLGQKSIGVRCALSAENILADCHIGLGRAILVADADLLNDGNWQGTGIRQLFGLDDFGNLDLVQRLIDALQK